MERFCSEQVDLRVNLDIFRCSMKGKCALAEIGDVLSIMDRLQHWYEKYVGQYRKVRLQAATGNLVVQKILQEWIEVIASALVGFVHMFNPEQILIGGGVSAQEDLFIAPVRSYVMKHVMPNFAKDLEICAAALKNEAGMVGAVYYCIQQERECDC